MPAHCHYHHKWEPTCLVVVQGSDAHLLLSCNLEQSGGEGGRRKRRGEIWKKEKKKKRRSQMLVVQLFTLRCDHWPPTKCNTYAQNSSELEDNLIVMHSCPNCVLIAHSWRLAIQFAHAWSWKYHTAIAAKSRKHLIITQVCRYKMFRQKDHHKCWRRVDSCE